MTIFPQKIYKQISWYWQYIFYKREMSCQEKARLQYADVSAFQSAILMFHVISSKEGLYSCTMTPEEFAGCLDFLADQWEVLALPEAAERIREMNPQKKRFAVLTFDDISATFYTAAWPELKKRNMPYTIFVAPELIDKEDFIRKTQLEEIVCDPLCTLGGHSMSHGMLRFSPEMGKEIQGSGEHLREMFHVPVRFFAYPYGTPMAVSGKSRDVARQSGYEMAFSAIPGTVNPSLRDLFWIPRVHSRLFMEWHKAKSMRS